MSTTSDSWNHVACDLADHNLDLPDAQLYAVKAVHSVEDQAVQISLARLTTYDLRRMSNLASYWDTLGWVYFRQGDLEKAQKFIDAAWNLKQNREIGEHLAQIYEKHERKREADHHRALARALPVPGDQILPPLILRRDDGTYITSKPEQKALAEELTNMRRTKLGKLSPQPGRGEFFVLIAPGGAVKDVEFIEGDEALLPLSSKLATLKFKAPIPDDAPVMLVRRGVLVCDPKNLECQFTLIPVDSVRSTQ